MSQKNLVDKAFTKFRKDPGAVYELSNVALDLDEAEALEYFLNKLKPFDEKLSLMLQGGTSLVRDLLSKWTLNGGDVSKEHFKEISDWVAENLLLFEDHDIIIQECMDMAILFSPQGNYFSDDQVENSRFSDTKLINFWVEKGIEHAASVSDWLYIIEVIAQPYSGSHLADTEWGKKILERGIAALSNKDAKMLQKKCVNLIEGFNLNDNENCR